MTTKTRAQNRYDHRLERIGSIDTGHQTRRSTGRVSINGALLAKDSCC